MDIVVERKENMVKRIFKMFAFVMVATMLMSGSVNAASHPSFSFTLGNTGKSYNRISVTYNKKVYKSDPWTLKVKSITCAGNYGISFCPAKYNISTKVVKKCTSSSTWCNSTGYRTVGYSSSDAALTNYRLAARQDDDYYSTFKATGWFNADAANDY